MKIHTLCLLGFMIIQTILKLKSGQFLYLSWTLVDIFNEYAN